MCRLDCTVQKGKYINLTSIVEIEKAMRRLDLNLVAFIACITYLLISRIRNMIQLVHLSKILLKK